MCGGNRRQVIVCVAYRTANIGGILWLQVWTTLITRLQCIEPCTHIDPRQCSPTGDSYTSSLASLFGYKQEWLCQWAIYSASWSSCLHVSPWSVANYVSGIKAPLTLYHQPVEWMAHPMIGNYLRAVHITVLSRHKPRSTFSLRDFYNISVVR